MVHIAAKEQLCQMLLISSALRTGCNSGSGVWDTHLVQLLLSHVVNYPRMNRKNSSSVVFLQLR